MRRLRAGPAPSGVRAARAARAGFTLIEVLVVLVLVAIASGVIVLSLRGGDERQLDEEGARLAALLEMARAEARVAGLPVLWVPATLGDGPGAPAFRFVGLPARLGLPGQWLAPGVSAQVVGAAALRLGPDAILPPQRVRLRLGERQLEVASDGLGPFGVAPAGGAP